MWQVWVEINGDAFAWAYCDTKAEAEAEAQRALKGTAFGKADKAEVVPVVED